MQNQYGWCQHYDAHSDRCCLSEQKQSSGHRDYNCKSDQNCKTCGNYEAWVSGKNYTNK
ncbi:MAG: hypothetical protein LBK66_11645 [Spirochaetaceae bacterium]|nr:hypothetical protein [Spirochaetaceae bacterium]